MKHTKGFTLLELMIVVAVVAILVSIALPSYRAYAIRANRTAAIEALLTAAACEERIYSRTGQYVFDNTCKTTPKGYNKLTIGKFGDTVTLQKFRIKATPNGGQADDVCGALRIDQTGLKNRLGSGKTHADCWAGK